MNTNILRVLLNIYSGLRNEANKYRRKKNVAKLLKSS